MYKIYSEAIHYRRNTNRTEPGKRAIILEMLRSGKSVKETANHFGLSPRYISRLRWEERLTPMRMDHSNEPEPRSLAIELVGDERKRYREIKRYRDYCSRCHIEWTWRGLKSYLKKLHRHRRYDAKRRGSSRSVNVTESSCHNQEENEK